MSARGDGGSPSERVGSDRPADVPLVLFYTDFFQSKPDLPPLLAGQAAHWSYDRRDLGRADIVIFHVPNYRTLGRARKYPGQVWVAWSLESSINYPQLVTPSYMRHFDLRMTYEQTADVWMPYLPGSELWTKICSSRVLPKSEPAPLVMFISGGTDNSRRTERLLELSRYVPIDSYGRLFRNRSFEGPDLGQQTKLDVISRYQFCVAFENSITPDYVTEKIYEPLLAGTIPVYLGAPNVAEFVPQDSYIDASDFPDMRALSVYLRHLSMNPEAAFRYHRWRERPLPDALVKKARLAETPPFGRLLRVVDEGMPHTGPLRSQTPSWRRFLADGLGLGR